MIRTFTNDEPSEVFIPEDYTLAFALPVECPTDLSPRRNSAGVCQVAVLACSLLCPSATGPADWSECEASTWHCGCLEPPNVVSSLARFYLSTYGRMLGTLPFRDQFPTEQLCGMALWSDCLMMQFEAEQSGCILRARFRRHFSCERRRIARTYRLATVGLKGI